MRFEKAPAALIDWDTVEQPRPLTVSGNQFGRLHSVFSATKLHKIALIRFLATLGGSWVMLFRNPELLRSMKMMSRLGTVALLAILGTVLVFLFPAAIGPFTATNGPATALRAAASVQALLMLLCSSLLVALLQRSSFSATVEPVSPCPGGHDFASFSLRC
jgi:hypothetical protein